MVNVNAISIQRKGNADIRVPKARTPEICPICWLPRMAPRFEVFTDAMTLRSGTTSVFDVDGSALIVHAGIDDYATDSYGNAGTELSAE